MKRLAVLLGLVIAVLAVAPAYATPGVFQWVKCTTNFGGPILVLSAPSGGSFSPSFITCNGHFQRITASSGATIYLNEPTDGAFGGGTRYRFSVGGSASVFYPITVCGSGTCPNITLSDYFETLSAYQAEPQSPPVWDAALSVSVTGTYLGVAASTLVDSYGNQCVMTTVVSGGKVSCNGWADYGKTVTVESPIPDGGNSWVRIGVNTFNPTTGGGTYTVGYACSGCVEATVSATTSTHSIVGILAPDSAHWAGALDALIFPLAGLSFAVIPMLMFKRKGDQVVYFVLGGWLAGALVSDLPTGSSSPIGIPFGMAVTAGITLFLWWWDS